MFWLKLCPNVLQTHYDHLYYLCVHMYVFVCPSLKNNNLDNIDYLEDVCSLKPLSKWRYLQQLEEALNVAALLTTME